MVVSAEELCVIVSDSLTALPGCDMLAAIAIMGRRPREFNSTPPLPASAASAIVTLKDIAAHCGLSRWAVSAALRDHPDIAAATRERVKAVALSLGYNPALNSSARRLTMRKHGIAVRNHLIALFADRQLYEHHSYWTGIFRGLMDEFTSQRYSLLHVYGWEANDCGPAAPAPYGIERGEVDGAVVFGSDLHLTIERLRQCPGFAGRPILTLILPTPGCAMVGVDYRQGACDAVRHLVELGHRHFLFLAPAWSAAMTPDNPTNRLPGLLHGLAEAGLPPAHLHRLPVDSSWMISPPRAGDGEDELPVEYVAAQDTTGRELVAHLEAHAEITAILATAISVRMPPIKRYALPAWPSPSGSAWLGLMIR